MLGVVIVDDEALVRVNLRSMIDWENEGYTILGEAENGEKGLELILHLRPDIVIADIKMPIMDGLEMISSAKAKYDGARYISLTSYEEFGLLKSAMHLGVADYLLKLELTPEVLLNTLEAQKQTLLSKHTAVESRDISPVDKVGKILCDVFAGIPADCELDSLLRLAVPQIDSNQLCAVAIRLALPTIKRFDSRNIESAALGIIKDIAKNYFEGVAFPAEEGLYLFVYSPKSESVIEEMCQVIIRMLRQYLNAFSAVGIGSATGNVHNIEQIMSNSILALEEVFYQGYGNVLHAPKDAQLIEVERTEWPQELRQAIELQNIKRLNSVFCYLHNLLKMRIHRNEAYNLCFTVASLSLSALKRDKVGKNSFDENLYDVIGETNTLEELREWLRSFEARLLDILNLMTNNKTGDERIVMEAKRFITENCRSQINLNMVAEHLFISASYLSNVFKRTSGVSFVEYVTDIKMEEAKALLLSGNYKVYEVSEMLGYEYSSYFSKLFFKTTGYSPKEFIVHYS